MWEENSKCNSLFAGKLIAGDAWNICQDHQGRAVNAAGYFNRLIN